MHWIFPSIGQRGWKNRLRWLGLRLLGYYVLIVVGVAIFQRWLIYLPTRVPAIHAQDAGLSHGSIRDISLTTRDGLELHGWHLLPVGTKCSDTAECDAALKAATRVVLYFHANAGNRSERVAECRSFTELGAHVLLFDYRGYGENPGSPSEEGLASDASAVWDYATKNKGIAPDRLFIFGESLGGAVATRLASEQCAAGVPPAGLVLLGTFSSLADTGAYLYPWLPVRLLLIDRFPSIDRITSATCPVLQIHGANDDMVPIRFARKLFAAVPEKSASGVRKRLVELPGAGHNDFPEEDFRTPVREFFAIVAR
jgi:pimeloyl-ACP methyl ester carboxylesterase